MTKPGEILYQLAGEVMVPLTVLHVDEVLRQSPQGESFTDNVIKLETFDGQIVEDFNAAFFFVPFIPEIENELIAEKEKAKAA